MTFQRDVALFFLSYPADLAAQVDEPIWCEECWRPNRPSPRIKDIVKQNNPSGQGCQNFSATSHFGSVKRREGNTWTCPKWLAVRRHPGTIRTAWEVERLWGLASLRGRLRLAYHTDLRVLLGHRHWLTPSLRCAPPLSCLVRIGVNF